MGINVLALIVGFVYGAITTKMGLPLAAPNALPGVLGIIGLYLGYLVMR